MDDFAKIQPHQIADNKIVITFELYFCVCFMSFSGPFNYAFVVSFKLRFFFNKIRSVGLAYDQATICI